MTENPTPPVGDPTPGAGSTPPSYGAPAPSYGEPPAYQQQAPGYGAPQQQYGAPQGFGGVGAVSDSDRRTWSMLAHLGGIVLGFIAPLVVWLMYKDRDEFVKDQAQEALNFQITLAIAYAVSTVLTFVLIGIFTFAIAWIGGIILMIIAGMAANRGERYRYPLTLRLVK
jgi:hypothetical protein